MRIDVTKLPLAMLAIVLPVVAHAQNIPPAIAALALSPILVFALAAAHGFLSRSWRVGFAHAGLVAIWLLLLGVASYWVENDYVIWTPLALYGIHAVTLVILIVKGVLRRARN